MRRAALSCTSVCDAFQQGTMFMLQKAVYWSILLFALVGCNPHHESTMLPELRPDVKLETSGAGTAPVLNPAPIVFENLHHCTHPTDDSLYYYKQLRHVNDVLDTNIVIVPIMTYEERIFTTKKWSEYDCAQVSIEDQLIEIYGGDNIPQEWREEFLEDNISSDQIE